MKPDIGMFENVLHSSYNFDLLFFYLCSSAANRWLDKELKKLETDNPRQKVEEVCHTSS